MTTETGPSQAYWNPGVLFVLEICAYWPGGWSRVRGAQGFRQRCGVWARGKSPGFQSGSVDGSLVPCLPFLLKTSSTEGWRSDRAVKKSTQPSTRAELSTLSRKGTVNPASLFSKGGTTSQGGKSLDQSYTTEND